MKAGSKRVLGVAAAILLIAGGAEARITRIEIVDSEPAFGGASFGDAGAYVRLVGRVHGELDPADPANSIIQDIALAPRNARGMVEYSTNIELLKPADLARSNRVLAVRGQQPRQQARARQLQRGRRAERSPTGTA